MNPDSDNLSQPLAIQLSMAQKFELEKSLRAIDQCEDIEALRGLSKTLASAWMSQRAATNWVIKNQFLG